MSEVSPFAIALLRLIQMLQEEEQLRDEDGYNDLMASKGNKTHRRNRSYGVIRFASPEDDSLDENNSPVSCGDGDGNESERQKVVFQIGDDPSIRQGRRSRKDGAMNVRRPHSNSRGRTPSPKRTPAPKPPSPRDCPSPLPKMVSTADVTPADHQGWLIDQLRGRKVWCAVSDMLFCVFEKEDSRVSKQVILLPGCKVRAIEFKSANQDGRVLNEVARRFASKTVTGVDKYQFLIENSSNRQKFMFGVVSKSDLDVWMKVLVDACCIDVGSPSAEENVSDVKESGETKIKSSLQSPRGVPPAEDAAISSSSYSPAQTLPSRLDVLSLTLPLPPNQDVSKGTIDHIRRRIRKEGSEGDSKPSPMRASHKNSDEGTPGEEPSASVNGAEDHRKTWHFKIRSPLELLRRRKRSSSADDAQRRRKMFPIMEPDTMSNPSLSPRLSNSVQSLTSSLESNPSIVSHDTSFTSSADSKDEETKKGRHKKWGFLSRSWDTEKGSRGIFSSSIHRTASDFKAKMFSNSPTSSSSSSADAISKSRSAGVRLRDLEDPRISGGLRYRSGFKWTKVWCVLCRGCFYAFKTSKSDESPILAVVLNQCSVTYVADGENLPKRMFIFKMTRAHCKSVYICAESHHALLCWMEALQTEAVKVQVDDSLISEMNESRSSQRKREVKEKKEREHSEERTKDTSNHGSETLHKRYSCPDFSTFGGRTDEKTPGLSRTPHPTLHNLDSSTRHGNPRETGDSESNSPSSQVSPKKSGIVPKSNPESPDKDSETGGVLVLNKTNGFSPRAKDATVVTTPPYYFSSDDGHYGDYDESPEVVCGGFTSSDNWNFLRPSKQRTAGENHDYLGVPQQNNGEDQSGDFIIQAEPLTAVSTDTFPRDPNSFDQSALSVLSPLSMKPNYSHNNLNPQSPREAMASYSLHVDQEGKDLQSLSSDSAHKSTGFLDFDEQHSESWEEGIYSDGSKPLSARNYDDQLKYTVESPAHDEAVKESWSTDEEFLLGVVRDKLRRRRQRLAVEGSGSDVEGREVIPHLTNGHDVLIVNDGEKSHRDMTSYDNEDGLNLSPGAAPDILGDEERPEEEEEEESLTPDDIQMEGLVEKRDVEDKWSRYWCRLKDGCLYSYLTPNHQTAAGSTDLRGYAITELIDAIQGKRFVLHLSHKSYVEIFLSLDSRNELEAWKCALELCVNSSDKELNALDEDGLNGLTRGSRHDGHESSVPRTQEVKQKLLAEMLRQKTELEKMQAARNGMKVWSSLDQGFSPSTSYASSKSSSLSPRTTDMDDRICALTRLQQRRMSTQIKIQAIRRQLDETSTGSKEKKTVFQIGRKRPDLIQSHDQNQTRQSDLEEQVKSLSSRLQEIDYHLSSHAINSPRDTAETSPSKKGPSLRHSYDLSLLKHYSSSTDSNGFDSSLKESNVKNDGPNDQLGPTIKTKEKIHVKEKDKEVNRSNSFKSSIQRFAHRTFARANWNRIKKSVATNSNKSSNNHKNHEEKDDSELPFDSERTEKPPDVIDITANHSSAALGDLSATSLILAPPDSFKTEESGSSISKTSERIRKHRTPKERIWAKLAPSNSFSTWDRLNSRIKTSASSPNLYSNMKSGHVAAGRRCATPQFESSEMKPNTSVPRLELNIDCGDQNGELVTTPPTDGSGSSADQDCLSSGFFSDRSSDAFTRRRGSDKQRPVSARSERIASPRKSDRNSWACGFSPRKEVNPNALAEIQAFEQLSNKFLGS